MLFTQHCFILFSTSCNFRPFKVRNTYILLSAHVTTQNIYKLYILKHLRCKTLTSCSKVKQCNTVHSQTLAYRTWVGFDGSGCDLTLGGKEAFFFVSFGGLFDGSKLIFNLWKI